MSAASIERSGFRFRVGLVLIATSYPLWAGAVVMGALQLRAVSFPWWRIAAAALVLNWICFAAGILIAGREAVSYLHRRAARFLREASAKGKAAIKPADE